MRVWLQVLCALFSGALHAQAVLYTPISGASEKSRFEVVGKAGDFYWVHKSKTNPRPKKGIAPWIEETDFSFDVYDAQLRRVRSIAYTLGDTVLKQYLIAGPHAFDQVLLTQSVHKTNLVLRRLAPDGSVALADTTLDYFPEGVKANDVLLVRSPHKQKLLLLGFEPVADAAPRLHVLLFDSRWRVLFHSLYTNPNLTQPFIQYDFSNGPLEYFDNSPIKLTAGGNWLMLAAARQSNNFILYQFQPNDSSVYQTTVPLTQRAGLQYASLAIDEAANEGLLGILFNTRNPAVKKVHTAHYTLSQCHLDFDTTYQFSTAATQAKEPVLFEQTFTAVAGKGFLFLKEYGKPYSPPVVYDVFENTADDTLSLAVSKPASTLFQKGDYTRYSQLSAQRPEYERGDLSVYYFPAQRGDSCWSGILNKAQTSSLNVPYLSYAFVSLQNKILLLYNDGVYKSSQAANTTTLDAAGHSLDEGVVFWRTRAILDFQGARQIETNELAVPYKKSRGQGFAIVRL